MGAVFCQGVYSILVADAIVSLCVENVSGVNMAYCRRRTREFVVQSLIYTYTHTEKCLQLLLLAC